VSASVKDDVLTVTFVNLDMENAHDVQLCGLGRDIAGAAEIAVLRHDEPWACNTFEAPHNIVPAMYKAVLTEGDVIQLPAASVVAVTVRLS